jgi:hypothetical protein
MVTVEPRRAFLYPNKNGIETSIAIMDALAGFSKGRPMLQQYLP